MITSHHRASSLPVIRPASALLLLSLLLIPSLARAERPATNAPQGVQIRVDFKDAPLNELVIFLSQLKGENFIILDQDLRDHTLTVFAPQPVSVDDARELILTALKLRGLKIEHNGAYWLVYAP